MRGAVLAARAEWLPPLFPSGHITHRAEFSAQDAGLAQNPALTGPVLPAGPGTGAVSTLHEAFTGDYDVRPSQRANQKKTQLCVDEDRPEWHRLIQGISSVPSGQP